MHDLDENAKAMIVVYRLDPTYYLALDYSEWCRAPHPTKDDYMCSRERGHTGLHFAQYSHDIPGHGGSICDITPNPWSDEWTQQHKKSS